MAPACVASGGGGSCDTAPATEVSHERGAGASAASTCHSDAAAVHTWADTTNQQTTERLVSPHSVRPVTSGDPARGQASKQGIEERVATCATACCDAPQFLKLTAPINLVWPGASGRRTERVKVWAWSPGAALACSCRTLVEDGAMNSMLSAADMLGMRSKPSCWLAHDERWWRRPGQFTPIPSSGLK